MGGMIVCLDRLQLARVRMGMAVAMAVIVIVIVIVISLGLLIRGFARAVERIAH